MDTQPEPLRIKPRCLPAYVERKRARQAATDTADRKRYEKPIDAHLAAQRMALDGLSTPINNSPTAMTSTSLPTPDRRRSGRCQGVV